MNLANKMVQDTISDIQDAELLMYVASCFLAGAVMLTNTTSKHQTRLDNNPKKKSS
jgi:hypothetical protein